MWQRKTEAQIDTAAIDRRYRKDARRHAFVVTGISSIGLFLCLVMFPGRTMQPSTFREAIIGTILFIPIVWLSSYYYNRHRMRSHLCNRCFRCDYKSTGDACDCGGEFEPLDHWEWVEDRCDSTT